MSKSLLLVPSALSILLTLLFQHYQKFFAYNLQAVKEDLQVRVCSLCVKRDCKLWFSMQFSPTVYLSSGSFPLFTAVGQLVLTFFYVTPVCHFLENMRKVIWNNQYGFSFLFLVWEITWFVLFFLPGTGICKLAVNKVWLNPFINTNILIWMSVSYCT